MCESGTGGDNCAQVLKKCTANQCGRNGKCIDLADQKTKCVCHDSFTGDFCEAKVDPCYPDPCSGVGFCEPLGNGFKCHCLNGYTGETCQVFFYNKEFYNTLSSYYNIYQTSSLILVPQICNKTSNEVLVTFFQTVKLFFRHQFALLNNFLEFAIQKNVGFMICYHIT